MANPIGSVNKLTGVVNVRHADGSTEVLRQGAPVFQGDTLETGGDGSVGVVFVDKSTFSLGPKGRMVMDEMVFDPAHPGEGHATMVALSGAFSFVSGQVAKAAPEAMQIKTPVMTIGVRGTSVAGVAAPEGSSNVVTLLRDGDGTLGQVTVRNAAGFLVLNAEAQTLQSSSFIRAFEPPRQLSAAEVLALFSAALAAQPLPPAPPPAVPQHSPEPPPPASHGEGGQAQPEPEAPHSGGDTPPTAPPILAALQVGQPVDPMQVIAILGLLNVWLANWIVTELGGEEGVQDHMGEGGDLWARVDDDDETDTDTGADGDEDRANIIIGSANDDTLTGTNGADQIYGLGGDDTIYGLAGNDTIMPGSGYDSVYAGDGDDVIEMTLDNSFDTVHGGAGHDTLSYAAETVGLTVNMASGVVYDGSYSDNFTGIEVFIGGMGNDQITGSSGNDTIYGGIGSDSIIGNLGDDVLYGEVGNDTLEGGDGNDVLDGGTGNDSLAGGSGADTVYGGTGDDMIFLTLDNANDSIDGGTGSDTISFWTETSRIEVSLNAGTFTYTGSDSHTYTDTITNVENVTGGSGNDWLTGNSGANWLSGGTGNDTLDGGAGNDTLDGGVGDDTLIGWTGDDTLIGGTGADTFFGGLGNDTLISQADGSTDVFRFMGTSGATNLQRVISLGTDQIQGFETADQIVLGSNTFGFASGTLSVSQYAEATFSPFGSFGTGAGIVAYYNGSDVQLWYTSDLSDASADNSYQIATLAGANLSTISETNFVVQAD